MPQRALLLIVVGVLTILVIAAQKPVPLSPAFVGRTYSVWLQPFNVSDFTIDARHFTLQNPSGIRLTRIPDYDGDSFPDLFVATRNQTHTLVVFLSGRTGQPINATYLDYGGSPASWREVIVLFNDTTVTYVIASNASQSLFCVWNATTLVYLGENNNYEPEQLHMYNSTHCVFVDQNSTEAVLYDIRRWDGYPYNFGESPGRMTILPPYTGDKRFIILCCPISGNLWNLLCLDENSFLTGNPYAARVVSTATDVFPHPHTNTSFLTVRVGTDLKLYLMRWRINTGTQSIDAIWGSEYEVGNLWAFGLAHDFDQDGEPDLIANLTTSTYPNLLSGADGSNILELLDIQYGLTDVVNLSDVTGDGLPEVVLAGLRPGNCHLVDFNASHYTAFWEAVIHWHDTPSQHPPTGSSVEALPDLDGDGLAEVATGYVIYTASSWYAIVDCYWGCYDANAPSVLLESPLNKTVYATDLVNLVVQVDDPLPSSGVRSVVATVNKSRNIMNYNPSIDRWVVTLSGLSDGIYYWNASAVDETAYLGTSETWCFYVDTTPPRINITSPSNYTYFNQSTASAVLVTWDASDNLGIEQFEVYRNGSRLDILPSDTRSYTVALPSEGCWNITVLAKDRAGWHNTSCVFLYADFTPPDIEITSPQNNTNAGALDVTLLWVGSDNSRIDHYSIRCWSAPLGYDSGWIYCGSATTSYTLSLPTSGFYNATVIAYDIAENTNQSFVSFFVDLTPPSVEILYPSNGSLLGTNTVTVNWTVSDDVRVIATYLRCYNRTWDSGWVVVTGMSNYTFYGLSDGNYTVELNATDIAERTNQSFVYFLIDTTPPTLTILQPKEGSILTNSTVLVEWQGSDANLDHYEVRLQNASWDSGWINTGLKTSYNFTNLAASYYNVSVKALDIVGNLKVAAVTFGVDLAPPQIQITHPQNQSFVNALTLSWTATDDLGIANFTVWVKFTGGGFVYGPQNTTANSLFIPLSGDGNYTACVEAYDYVGRSTRAVVIIYVDQTPPKISITAPQNGAYLPTTSIFVSWQSSDTIGLSKHEVWINGSLYRELGPDDTQCSLSGLSDARYVVEVRAYDLAGNFNASSIFFIVDTTPPQVEIAVTSSVVNTTSVLVSWSANDNYGVESFSVFLDTTLYSTDLRNTSLLLTNLPEGYHNITVHAIDYAGNLGYASIQILVDLTPPVVTITSPSSGAEFDTPNITIAWQAEDALSGIREIFVSLDGSAWQSVGLASSYKATNLSPGEHIFTVRVYDRAGNVAEASVRFTVSTSLPGPPAKGALPLMPWIAIVPAIAVVPLAYIFLRRRIFDTTPPELVLHAPQSGDIFSSPNVEVKWWGEDKESGIHHYELRVDDDDWIDVGTQTRYELYLEDGEHRVAIRAFDKRGNVAEVDAFFVVDQKPPVLSIEAPPKARLPALIRWSVEDELSGVERVQLRVDDGEWIDVTERTSYELSELPPGEHRITIRAYDRAGNVAEREVILLVERPGPPSMRELIERQLTDLRNRIGLTAALVVDSRGFPIAASTKEEIDIRQLAAYIAKMYSSCSRILRGLRKRLAPQYVALEAEEGKLFILPIKRGYIAVVADPSVDIGLLITELELVAGSIEETLSQ